MQTSAATFKISNYKFNKIHVDYDAYVTGDIDIAFEARGEFSISKKEFRLFFSTSAKSSSSEVGDFLEISCIGIFSFENVDRLINVPPFFYSNAIAILFPYMRAYISMITSQSMERPVILPTLNLSSLEGPLKQETVEVN